MGSPLSKVVGRSPWQESPNWWWSDEEKAIWPYFSPFAKLGQGVFISACEAFTPSPDVLQTNGRFFGNFGVDDDPLPAWLLNRLTNTLLVPGYSERSPLYLLDQVDTVPGRPCFAVGLGGSGPNVRTSSVNGDMIPAEDETSTYGERGDVPIVDNDGPISFGGRIMVPIPSTAVNGLTPGATVGRAMAAGRSTTIAENWSFQVHSSTGEFQFRTQDTGGTSLVVAGDERTAIWFDFFGQYDPAGAGLASYWKNAGAAVTQAGTVGINSNANARRLHLWGMGGQAPINSAAVMFTKSLFVVPGLISAVADFRTKFRAFTATL